MSETLIKDNYDAAPGCLRTQSEMITYANRNEHPLFGGQFVAEVLLSYLEFDTLKGLGWLKEGVKKDDLYDCESYMGPPVVNEVKKDMLDYLPFAIEKAEDERGLSSVRSLIKIKAWLWLLGDNEMVNEADNATGYGLDFLESVQEKYNRPS